MQIKNIHNSKNKFLLERETIRKYDPSFRIPKQELINIIQDAMTAPSSLNLQPWRFAIIHTPEGKNLIKSYMSFNILQWETCSAIIGVFGDMENISYANDIYSYSAKENLITEEQKEDSIKRITEYIKDSSKERIRDTVLLDCGLISMQIMLSAKSYGYDTNPMGGYLRREFAESLGFNPERYIPALLIAIGKAEGNGRETVRFSVDDISNFY